MTRNKYKYEKREYWKLFQNIRRQFPGREKKLSNIKKEKEKVWINSEEIQEQWKQYIEKLNEDEQLNNSLLEKEDEVLEDALGPVWY